MSNFKETISKNNTHSSSPTHSKPRYVKKLNFNEDISDSEYDNENNEESNVIPRLGYTSVPHIEKKELIQQWIEAHNSSTEIDNDLHLASPVLQTTVLRRKRKSPILGSDRKCKKLKVVLSDITRTKIVNTESTDYDKTPQCAEDFHIKESEFAQESTPLRVQTLPSGSPILSTGSYTFRRKHKALNNFFKQKKIDTSIVKSSKLTDTNMNTLLVQNKQADSCLLKCKVSNNSLFDRHKIVAQKIESQPEKPLLENFQSRLINKPTGIIEMSPSTDTEHIEFEESETDSLSRCKVSNISLFDRHKIVAQKIESQPEKSLLENFQSRLINKPTGLIEISPSTDTEHIEFEESETDSLSRCNVSNISLFDRHKIVAQKLESQPEKSLLENFQSSLINKPTGFIEISPSTDTEHIEFEDSETDSLSKYKVSNISLFDRHKIVAQKLESQPEKSLLENFQSRLINKPTRFIEMSPSTDTERIEFEESETGSTNHTVQESDIPSDSDKTISDIIEDPETQDIFSDVEYNNVPPNETKFPFDKSFSIYPSTSCKETEQNISIEPEPASSTVTSQKISGTSNSNDGIATSSGHTEITISTEVTPPKVSDETISGLALLNSGKKRKKPRKGSLVEKLQMLMKSQVSYVRIWRHQMSQIQENTITQYISLTVIDYLTRCDRQFITGLVIDDPSQLLSNIANRGSEKISRLSLKKKISNFVTIVMNPEIVGNVNIKKGTVLKIYSPWEVIDSDKMVLSVLYFELKSNLEDVTGVIGTGSNLKNQTETVLQKFNCPCIMEEKMSDSCQDKFKNEKPKVIWEIFNF